MKSDTRRVCYGSATLGGLEYAGPGSLGEEARSAVPPVDCVLGEYTGPHAHSSVFDADQPTDCSGTLGALIDTGMVLRAATWADSCVVSCDPLAVSTSISAPVGLGGPP